MKKKYIIKKNHYIQKIISEKKTISNRYFIVYIKENNLEHFRIAISISKKVGKAVIRNKIKRQIKAIIYQKYREIIKNYDILLIVKILTKDLNFVDIDRNLFDVFKKAKLIIE